MSGLVHTLAAMGGDGFRVVYGTAHWDGSRWWANVGGNLLDPRWLDPIQPLQGGKLVIGMVSDGLGQSSALVLGGYTDQPRPSTGTVTDVVPAGVSTQIVFTGEDGASYTTDRFIGSYAIADQVYITWDAAKPTIIGKIPSITVTPPAPEVGGGPAVMPGSTTLIATATDTYGVGGWGRWAGSRNGGERVYTGTQSGYAVTGSWFYGAPKPELSGRTITRIQFYIPARLPGVGAYNSPATLHLYAHDHQARPGGDVARTAGPHDVTVPAGFGGAYIDLPTSFGPHLATGGGVSIAGDPYVGLAGRFDNPESGKLIIDWQA